MLESIHLFKLDRARQIHYIVEAMRRAYRDRAEFLGDSDYYNVPVKKLISRKYAKHLFANVHRTKATPSSQLKPVGTGGKKARHTTHFSIVDRFGNRVAATMSVNYPFGSCFVAKDTGVLLNDEMDDFSSKPGTPNAYGLVGAEANAIAPGKRMLSSMSPTFAETKDKVILIGTPGGSRIITMVFLGLLDFYKGASAKDIVGLARFHHQYLPDMIQFEKHAITEDQQRQLRAAGYHLQQLDSQYGNMHVIIIDKRTHQLDAASDPRGIGEAKVISRLK